LPFLAELLVYFTVLHIGDATEGTRIETLPQPTPAV
jgi:hypothetical protein